MGNQWRRITFLLLALVFTLGLVAGMPTMVQAAPDGSLANPFLVSTIADLKKVGTGQDGWDLAKSYKLTEDITVYATDFTPIGSDYNNAFTGTFDGGGYTITLDNCSLTAPDELSVGLFGVIEYATIERLHVTGILTGESGNSDGNLAIGGIVGTAYEAIINNCASTVDVTGRQKLGYLVAGGIVGSFSGVISNCYYNGDIITSNTSVFQNIPDPTWTGGIAGNNSFSTIEKCVFVSGRVNAAVSSGLPTIGRIFGYQFYQQGLCSQNYAAVTVVLQPSHTIIDDADGSDGDTATIDTNLFQTTLGWNPDIWDFSTTVPTLKQNVLADICAIGSTGYPTFKDAVDAVPTTGVDTTIVMLQNYTETANIVVENNKNITIDLNGYDLTIDSSATDNSTALTVGIEGKVTYTGNGEFSVNGDKCGVSVVGLNSFAAVTNASGNHAAYAASDGKIEIKKDVMSHRLLSQTIAYETGAYVSTRGTIHIGGDVTVEYGNGIEVSGLGNVTVDGNVTVVSGDNCSGIEVRQDNNEECGSAIVYGSVNTHFYGVYVIFSQTPSTETVFVGGNVQAGLDGIIANGGFVHVTGNIDAGAGGVHARNGAEVIVNGAIMATTTYITVGETEMSLADYVFDSTKPGYQKYTDGISTVWVLDQSGDNTDAQSVADDKAWLTFDRIKNQNTDEYNITGDLTLPTIGPNGSNIIWSFNPIGPIADNGKITRPSYGSGDEVVFLTADIFSGSASDSVIFILTVKEFPADPEVSPANLTIPVGGIDNFRVSFGAGGGATSAAISSLNEEIATVSPATIDADSSITVLGVSAGTTVIEVYFSGGTYTGGAKTVNITVSPISDKTLRFYSDGVLYVTKTVSSGCALETDWPNNPINANFSFGGWFTGANGTGTQYTNSTVINSDTDLYALWTYTPPAPSGGGGSGKTAAAIIPKTLPAEQSDTQVTKDNKEDKNLIATAIDTGVKLEWPSIDGALGYHIYRTDNPDSEGTSVSTNGINGNSFIDVNVDADTTYYYTLRAILVSSNPETLEEPMAFNSVTTLDEILGEKIDGKTKNFILMKLEDVYMSVNGLRKEIDPGRGTTPQLVNGRTLMPIRAVIESMGGAVGWDDGLRQITLNAGGHSVTMWLNSKELTADGESKEMDVAPVSINDRTMVPVRFAAENVGCVVEWLSATSEIVVVFYTINDQ